jgi:hypothetical protein
MAINFHDKLGRPDLALIDPAEVAKLSDEEQAILAIVVEAIQNREAAHERLRIAKEKVREAQRVEAEKFAAHQIANPPVTALEAHRASIAAFNGEPAPKKSTSHAKHAVVRPEMEWRKAQSDVADAQTELQAAMNHATRADKIEGEAMAALISVMPPPSAEDVHRQMVAREQARKLERVSKGLPADPPKIPTHGRSELDRLAAHRGKNAGSLRSTSIRR